MNNLVFLGNNNQIVTTSRKVAEVFGKRHTEVMRSIHNILKKSQLGNRRNFASVEYTDSKGETRPEYEMNREGFSLLVMGFTGDTAFEFKEKFNHAFYVMADELEKKKLGGGGQSLLQMAMALQAQVTLMVESAKTLEEHTKKINAIETVQENNQKELDAIPEIDADTPDPISLQALLRRQVVTYASANGLSVHSVWSRVYQDLYDIYHKNPKACKKINSSETLLQVCARKGYLNQVASIIKKLTNK